MATLYFSDIYHHKREWQDEEIEEAGRNFLAAIFQLAIANVNNVGENMDIIHNG